MDKRLSAKIVEIAQERVRFGYRRVHDMLRAQYPGVNQPMSLAVARSQNLWTWPRCTPRLASWRWRGGIR